jgi:diguanylate cyclase (GGDEF)-like protein
MISFSDVTELKYALFEMEAQKDQMELAKRHAERAQAAAERARREAERARGELQAEVAARRQLEEELRRLAHTDSLTGVLSRRGFDEALSAATSAARRHGYPVSLIAIDVDHFKAVNDTYGHAAGDVVLKSAAAMLRDELRRHTDVLGRVGGEEFMVVLPHTTLEGATLLAERLRERLSRLPITVGANIISVTASFGVNELGPAGDHELMKIGADDALYEAKRSGRNRVVTRRPEGEAARPQARSIASG